MVTGWPGRRWARSVADRGAEAARQGAHEDHRATGRGGMKESIDAASSFVRSISLEIGVKPPKFETMDIHVHVPEGATPKDGPRPGRHGDLTSVLTQILVRKGYRDDGRGQLRGQCAGHLAGLSGKADGGAARRIKTVLIPEENAKDLPEIPDNAAMGWRSSRCPMFARFCATRCARPSRWWG
ncbi:MAG: S16 family serine protease [Paracoccaceae bacterium]